VKTFLLTPNKREIIGHAGEVNEIAIAMNVTSWIEDAPDGVPGLMCIRPDTKRIPVTCAVTDGLLVAELPEECTRMPGLYSYSATWTQNGSIRFMRGYTTVLLSSELVGRGPDHGPRTPDWAREIFIQAEQIRSALDAALQLRDMADSAAASKADAEAAAGRAETAAEETEATLENLNGALEAMEDGYVVATSVSTGKLTYVPIDVKAGETVYVDVKFENDSDNNLYMVALSPDGSTLLPGVRYYEQQVSQHVAPQDITHVVVWYSVMPTSVVVKAYKQRIVNIAGNLAAAAPLKTSSIQPTEVSNSLVMLPFESHPGDEIYVNVSDVVGTWERYQISLGNSATERFQHVEVEQLGVTKLVATKHYHYVAVWFHGSGASVTGARVTACLGSARSRFKTYSILGDSYSAYHGYIPEGNHDSYPISGNDVDDVSQMWWRVWGDQNGATLELDESYSGSSVCTYAYGHDQTPGSFVTRVKNLPNSDVIFVFGGTNDVWGNAALGEYVYSGWTTEQLSQFRPAYAYVLSWLRAHRGDSEIFAVINSELTSSFVESIKTIAAYYGVKYIELENVAKISGHPNKAGMAEIGAQVSDALLSYQPVTAYDGQFKAVAAMTSDLQQQIQEIRDTVGTMAEFKAYLGLT
jgi:hypothetical protein